MAYCELCEPFLGLLPMPMPCTPSDRPYIANSAIDFWPWSCRQHQFGHRSPEYCEFCEASGALLSSWWLGQVLESANIAIYAIDFWLYQLLWWQPRGGRGPEAGSVVVSQRGRCRPEPLERCSRPWR